MSQPADYPPRHSNLFDRPLPPGYRDELQALIADRPADPPRRTGSTLLFQLGELRLALPTRIVSAVAPILHIARIPHRSGTVLLGLAAFRGDILPCCSLARLLDVPQKPEKKQTGAARMLILEESPGLRWACPIDGVLGIRILGGQQPAQAAPIASHWFKGSFHDNATPCKAGSDQSGLKRSGLGGNIGIFHLLDHEVLFRQITLATA
ncbi:MAG: chemotaxis protein CheW [Terracidiphilus sp.]|jgi:chemotaxis-related protein WspD